MKQTTNTAQEIRAKIEALIGSRAEQLAEISEKISEARAAVERCSENMKKAQAETNLTSYAAAKAAKLEAETAVEMFSGRAAQLQGKELISEEESDSVIDSLLDYEAKISADYEAAIAGPLNQLQQLQKDYEAAIADAEAVLRLWTTQVHANYRSQSTTFAETGTNRSPRPIPVRNIAYHGCNTAQRVRAFLDKEKQLQARN